MAFRTLRQSKFAGLLLRDFLASPHLGVGLKTHTFGNSIVAGVDNIAFLDEAVYACAPNLIWVSNEGIAGNTTEQMIDRLATDIPDTADAVLIMEGSNDAGAGLTPGEHYANMAAIVDHFAARGIVPILVAPPPRSGSVALTTAYHAATYLVALDRGINIFDPWLDSVETDGDWVSGADSDGIHPTHATSQTAAANLAAQILGTDAAPQFAPRSNSAGTAGYCLSGGNCFMLSDSNSDGTPDGWTLVGGTPGTASLVSAPTGFRGQFARHTANSAGGYPYLRKRIAASGNFDAGDELLISMAVETSVDNTSNNQAWISVTVDGGVSDVLKQAHTASLGGNRIFKTVTPTTTGNLDVNLHVNNSYSGQYVGVGELEVYNLTKIRSGT